VPLTGSARVQVAASLPCGPDSSDPVAWPCSTRSPAGKPPAKAAGSSGSQPTPSASVRKPGIPQPGASRLAAGGRKPKDRWPSRQLGQAIPTTTTARRWLSFGNADGRTVFDDCPPSRPSQVARSSPFGRDASATTAARLVSFDLLRLPCITLRRLLRLRPLRSIPVGYTVQTAETGKGRAVVPVRQTKPAPIRALRSPDLQKTRRQKMAVRQVAVCQDLVAALLARLEPSLHSGSR